MTSRAGLHGDIFYIESERVDDVQKLVYTAKAMNFSAIELWNQEETLRYWNVAPRTLASLDETSTVDQHARIRHS